MKERKVTRITETGRYRTRNQQIAVITKIDGDRAYGTIPGEIDGTWWYTNSGQHALWPLDDLLEQLLEEADPG